MGLRLGWQMLDLVRLNATELFCQLEGRSCKLVMLRHDDFASRPLEVIVEEYRGQPQVPQHLLQPVLQLLIMKFPLQLRNFPPPRLAGYDMIHELLHILEIPLKAGIGAIRGLRA